MSLSGLAPCSLCSSAVSRPPLNALFTFFFMLAISSFKKIALFFDFDIFPPSIPGRKKL